MSSKKKFLYEATDIMFNRKETGEKDYALLYRDPNNLINASNRGKDSEGGHNTRPKEGYDGHVAIHPKTVFQEADIYGALLQKSRAATIVHELAENYYRTNNNLDYDGSNGTHNRAIKRENGWSHKSRYPGVISGFIGAPKPTPERLEEIREMINAYLKY